MKTERDLFEAWAKKETNWDLYWSENIKQYMDHQTNGAWFAWQARVPEGYVVVPKEPTQDQLEYGYRCGSKDAATIYRVMVVAESEK